MIVRNVQAQGDIKWKAKHVYLSETLAGELVGLRQVSEERWDIFFGPIRLAQLDTRERKLVHLKKNDDKKRNRQKKT